MFLRFWFFVCSLVTFHRSQVYCAPTQSISIDLNKGTSRVTLVCPNVDFALWYRADTGEEIIQNKKFNFPDLKSLVIKVTEIGDGLTVECKKFLGDGVDGMEMMKLVKTFKISVVKGNMCVLKK